MLVRIINGTYGHRPKLANGEYSHYVVPVTRNDPPIEVDEKEAARLISNHIAVYVDAEHVDGAVATALADVPDGGPIEDSSDNADGESGDSDPGEIAGHLDADALKEWDVASLRRLASDMGIDTTKLKKKDSLIEAICSEDVTVPDDSLVVDVEDVVE